MKIKKIPAGQFAPEKWKEKKMWGRLPYSTAKRIKIQKEGK